MKDPRNNICVSFMYALATSWELNTPSKGIITTGSSAVTGSGNVSLAHHMAIHIKRPSMEAARESSASKEMAPLAKSNPEIHLPMDA
eukprot:jgi/Pico_ML_1/51678/g251.t1